MKPTKEEFNELPQLDRIEFRQRLDLIMNSFYSDMPFLLLFLLMTIFWAWAYIGVFIILIVSFKIRNARLKELEKDYLAVKVKFNEGEKMKGGNNKK